MLPRRKTLVIGLDGATFDIIDPMVRRGELPSIAKLLHSGASGRLRSTFPPLTPPAWATFATGRNPGKHGVFDFVTKPYSMESAGSFTNFNSVKCATFWEHLSHANLKSGVVNLPMTYPPSPLNGFLISGMDTPNENVTSCYPEDLIEELRRCGIHYQTNFFYRGQHAPKDWQELLDHVFQIEEMHKDAMLHLLRNKEWDIFTGVFMLLDKVSHFFWSFHEQAKEGHAAQSENGPGTAVYQAYRLVDRLVGELLSAVPADTNVIMLSDHGFGKVEWILCVNEWLRRVGLLKLKPLDAFRRIKSVKFRKVDQSVGRLLDRLRLSPLRRLLPMRLLATRLRLRVPTFAHSAASVDWSRTKAYAGMYGVYVNLKDRTGRGVVHSGEECEQVKEQIRRELGSLTDPVMGVPLSDQIREREEIYRGPYLDLIPELIFDFQHPAVVPNHAYRFSEVWDHRQYFGTHQHEGILLIRGDGVKPGHRLDQCNIVDVAPTMFYLMRQPIPEDFDGKLLENAFEDQFLQTNPREFEETRGNCVQRGDAEKTYTNEEAAAVAERLRELGYLD